MVGVVKGTGIAETPLSDIDATPGGQVSDAYGGQTCAVSEFVIRFVSVICALNGRKVTMRILSMQKKIKI